jgi:hypothetical protein
MTGRAGSLTRCSTYDQVNRWSRGIAQAEHFEASHSLIPLYVREASLAYKSVIRCGMSGTSAGGIG